MTKTIDDSLLVKLENAERQIPKHRQKNKNTFYIGMLTTLSFGAGYFYFDSSFVKTFIVIILIMNCFSLTWGFYTVRKIIF